MEPLTRKIAAAIVLTTLLIVVVSEARAQDDLLVPLAGMWRVNGVRLNETLMRRPYYNYDDVRLIGRLVTFSKERIETDMAEGTACDTPKAEVTASTAGRLVAGSMGGSINGEAPTAKDFNLPLDGAKALNVWWITCQKGDVGPDTPFGPERHNWLAKLTEDQLAMRWYDNTILLLQKLPPNPQPCPSFDCQRATTPTEKQICTSFSLSELDQSVSGALKQVAKGLEDLGEHRQLKQLHRTQKKWLEERNRCGSNGDCVKKTMHDRLEQLAALNLL